MAKKVRFPLQMNGTDVRTIEELREHFDLESVLGYYANGKIVSWLRDRYYDNEASAIEALSAEDADLNQKIMSALGVTVDTDAEEIDMEIIRRRNEKLQMLRQFTDDKEVIDNVDCVAFNQDDLLDILDEGAEKIYLCEGEFDIPLSVKNVTYVGIKNPIVLLRAYDNVNFASLNIKLVDICFGWDISSITCNDRLYQAERLLERREFDAAIPMLEELVAEKNPKAISLLFDVYDVILVSEENSSKKVALKEEGANMGYVLELIESNNYSEEVLTANKVLLEKLASKNDRKAMTCLGFFKYLEGNYDKLLEWLTKASEKGEVVATALLFDFLREDVIADDRVSSTYRSTEKAMIYGEKAALLGHSTVANKMGLIYDSGSVVPQDHDKAFKYFKIAAEQGNHYAQYNLACCYETEKGVKQDYTKAIYWFEKAIVSGDADALFELGYCYEKGLGTTQDYKRAFELYEKAASAETPNISAQNNLGWMYQHGYGVPVNLERSLYWYDKAVAAGSEAAKTNSEFVRSEMSKITIDTSPEQKLRAEQKRMGDELKSELSSITDELRSEGFFNIMNN